MGPHAPVGDEDDAVRTPEAALTYAQHQVAKLLDAVGQAQQSRLATEQRRLYHVAVLRYGGALATLATLRATRLLADVAYAQLREECQRAMQPQVVVRPSPP